MPSFITAWVLYCDRYRRGKLLEKAVKRADGNLVMVDAALTEIVASETPVQLSVRRHITTEVYGLFLPCRTIKKHPL